ncbi:MAG: aspartate kinase, partial [Euryarchaeota archaeon]|nr:aspartate kinase [Euryarchaeota archaeon]
GAGPGGRVTTLGRGGSDYTATLLGAALGAGEVWLWKEVDGVMSADPRVVPGARTLGHMSYEEAMELSYFGAQVLHPRAMEPVIRRGIPVRVKNVFHPEAPGTLICKRPPRGGRGDGRVVKAIATIRDVALLNLAGAGMVGAPGSAGRIFSALGGAGVNVIMISQGSSERTISLLIEAGHVERALEALLSASQKEAPLRSKGGLRLDRKDISWDDGVCAVAAVGSGMRGTPGVAGRVFSTLGRAGVNVMMIAQGSSEYNISFVVRRAQMERAVRALHREFAMG